MAKKYRYGPAATTTQAVIFARVSSKEQEPGASLDAQRDAMIDYCNKQGLTILKKYRVIESSTIGKREQFNEMMSFVKKQKHKTAICVHAIDRFQRRFNECVEVENLLLDDKTDLHFCREGLILTKNSSSSDIMRWDMGILSGKMYVANLRDNVNRGMNYNWSIGKYQTKAPIGYLNTPGTDNKSTIIIDPERAPIVIKIFEEYATGSHSLKSIWQFAKEVNLVSVFSKTQKPISRATVYTILKNPFYYGEMRIRNEVTPHIYQPLIKKSLFDKVQILLSGDKIHTKPQEYAGVPFAFRGLIKCSTCGCTISPDNFTNKDKKDRYLRCSHLKGNCSQELVDESVIKQQLDKEVFSKIKINDIILELLKKNVQQKLIDESKANAVMKRQITNEIDKLDAREKRIKETFFDGGINRSEWDEEKANIATRRKELQETAEKYNDITKEIKETVNDVLDIAASASHIMQTANPLQQRQLLGLMFTECYLDGQKLIYTLQKPFDKLVDFSSGDTLIDFQKDNIADLSILTDKVYSYQENMRRLDENI